MFGHLCLLLLLTGRCIRQPPCSYRGLLVWRGLVVSRWQSTSPSRAEQYNPPCRLLGRLDARLLPAPNRHAFLAYVRIGALRGFCCGMPSVPRSSRAEVRRSFRVSYPLRKQSHTIGRAVQSMRAHPTRAGQHLGRELALHLNVRAKEQEHQPRFRRIGAPPRPSAALPHGRRSCVIGCVCIKGSVGQWALPLLSRNPKGRK